MLHSLFTGMLRAATIATLLKELSTPAMFLSEWPRAVGKASAAKYPMLKQKHFNQHYKEMQTLE